MKRFLLTVFLCCAYIGSALAQTSPNLRTGQVLTAAQWNQLFISKQDTLGYIPLNVAGGVMTGRLVTAPPSATNAGLNLTPGTTPGTPVNGDLWVTSTGIFAQINGSTVQLVGSSAGSFAATSPLTVSFPAGVVTYAFNFSVANTFLAPQTVQGATTTSPGWYSQIAGDTVPRVRIGMNATDVPSIAFGPGNAVRDVFIERVGAGQIRLGAPDAGSPVAQTISVQNVVAGTSNTAGATLTIAGSQSTGTGVGGSILFKTSPAGSTGTSQNALTTALTVFGTGGIATGAASDPGAGNLNLSGGVLLNNGTSPTGTGAYVRATSPSISGLTVTGSFTATGLSPLTNIQSQSANTIVGSATAGSPTALSIPSCSTSSSAIQWVTNTGFQCGTITASAASVTVGTTTVLSGTTTRVLFNNAGVLGEYVISGSGSVAMNTNPSITGGSHVAITNLGIRSSGTGAFDLTLQNTENLTAGRTLTFTVNDAARTISLSGNIVTGGAFTTSGGALTLTVTGATNVTLPTTGTLATLAGSEALTNKTVNGLTITSTTGTLTIANGKTLTVNNSITFSGTDATTMTFPTTSATIARTDAGQTFTGTNTFAAINSAAHVITSSSANALAAGLNGSTNPAFNVDASTASSATGWNIKSAAAASGAALSVISSGTNENGTIDAKGSGTLTLNGTATGGITLARAVTLSSTINKVTITAPATGSTLTIADGKTLTVSNSITFAGTDSTTMTFPSSNATIAALNLTGQVITGGASVTSQSLSTGNITVDCTSRPLQFITGSTSAWTITAPANDGSCIVFLTNAGASAVIPSFSGFTVGSNTGDSLTSVSSAKFWIWVGRINGTSSYSIKALQ